MIEKRLLSSLSRSIGALGVVYGDIGTSVLYAFKECLSHGLRGADIPGVLSLIIWTLVAIVSVKYVAIVMLADNQGEGGILAILALALPKETQRSHIAMSGIVMIGVAGAAMLYADGVITPAISVLSAVEGLQIATLWLRPFITPLALGILVGLFAIQSKGAGTIGKLFGPVMLVWFTILGVLGAVQIYRYPLVLHALNPLEAAHFLAKHGLGSLAIMGSVFLVVTGGEALYAGMGHFGRQPILRAWTFLVFPALVLNYLGQGALVLTHPDTQANPFFLLVPAQAVIPLVGIATAASIIAAQGLISGAFSVTKQAMQMGYIPHLRIVHTSKNEHGQVYVPSVNFLLAIGCLLLVLGFKSSDALASAYGIAIALAMLTTTLIFFVAVQRLRGWSPWRAGAVCLVFGTIEATFLAANSLKVLSGGWFPLLLGGVIFFVMKTWSEGRKQLRRSLPPSVPLSEFIAAIDVPASPTAASEMSVSPNTAIFVTEIPEGTPNAMIKNVKDNHIHHQQNVVLTIINDANRPYIVAELRVEVSHLTRGFFRVVARYGFMEEPDLERTIRMARIDGLIIHPEQTTYYVDKERICVTGSRTGMSAWRTRLFALLNDHTQNAVDHLRLPPDRVYEVSQVVEM